jgi:hypothetical protein
MERVANKIKTYQESASSELQIISGRYKKANASISKDKRRATNKDRTKAKRVNIAFDRR